MKNKQKKNMHILVLGNGFDVAHKLETRYKEFLDFCRTVDLEKSSYANEYIKCRDNNLWMKHFINKQNFLKENWIDLEEEIFNVIKAISSKQISLIKTPSPRMLTVQKGDANFDLQKIELRKPDFNEICEKEGYTPPNRKYITTYYIENITDLATLLYKQLRQFTKCFESYLINEILAKIDNNSKYRLSLQDIGVEEGCKDVFILSFNYTDTCERLYKEKFNTYCHIEKFTPIYVHGKVNNQERSCNLVLGTQSFDSDLQDISKKIPIDFYKFQKHNQRHKYCTIESYQTLLKELKNTDNIEPVFHVIGHSLDITDRKILRHIFLANENSIINVYYHDDEAQERLINNITQIIDEENVMERVRLIDQHDEIHGILKEKGNN